MAKRFPLVQRLDFLEQACSGKSVLHLGCTNWPYTEQAIDDSMLLHFSLEKKASELFGFDFDQEGLDVLAKHGSENLFQADLEQLDAVPLDKKFDVILAGEMIEHLNNPGLFLNGIKRFMHAETKLIITTINAYCGLRFMIYGFTGRGGSAEPVHPDHVAYYSYSTLKLLVQRAGLALDEFCFYDMGREHRPHNRKLYNIMNDVMVRFAPQWAGGVIAVCRLGRSEK